MTGSTVDVYLRRLRQKVEQDAANPTYVSGVGHSVNESGANIAGTGAETVAQPA